MNRRDFFVSAWKQNVRPVVIAVALIVLFLFLKGIDSISFADVGSIFAGIALLFGGLLAGYWPVLLIISLCVLLNIVLKGFVFPSYHLLIDKLFLMAVKIAILILFFRTLYQYYQQHQYQKIISLAVMLGIFATMNYFTRPQKQHHSTNE